ncbi:MAG: helix-turn-helix domain-containing protein [Parachlamydiales bacterium]|nr:helix-turn-helix domain-containing protein [Parachlamydiales bacterium]
MSTFQRQLGDLFKNKRQEMSLSLKEVENATSIRMLYLKAIEEGTIDRHLSQVYTIGFVKQYASFLGLDGEKIIKDNAKAFVQKAVKQEFDYGIGTLEVRNPPSGSKSLPSALWIVIGAVVLLGAWFFARIIGLF